MEPYADAIAETAEGVMITLDVTAGAKRDTFPAGCNVWRKSIRCLVTAPAVGGRANRAVVKLVADTLEIPRADVRIVHGQTSSSKTVGIHGRTKQEISAALKRSFQEPGCD
jgi:uncharacterized protein (TIGR00251 family)